MGEIRIRAKFRFSVKILESVTTAPTNYHVSWFQTTTTESVPAAGDTQNLLFATASANALNIVNTAGSFVPPVGNYLVDVGCSVHSSTNVLTIVALDVQKNGTSVFLSTLKPQIGSATTGTTDADVSTSVYVSCNGTDAITFPVTVSVSSGGSTNTAAGTVRFTSV
jgi:hypothetical protein